MASALGLYRKQLFVLSCAAQPHVPPLPPVLYGLQEESDAQYKNKGKKGTKADSKATADAASKADPALDAGPGTSTTAATTDADKDVEMVDAPSASNSEEKKHVGEFTGISATLCLERLLAADTVDRTHTLAPDRELDV